MEKLPLCLPKTGDGLVKFNRDIIDATAEQSVAYKINTAFYEQYGKAGWEWMEETLLHLPQNTLKIADAKRGDIGNTSSMYAKAFFETLPFDAITVAPYMGEDSLRPFWSSKTNGSFVWRLRATLDMQISSWVNTKEKTVRKSD